MSKTQVTTETTSETTSGAITGPVSAPISEARALYLRRLQLAATVTSDSGAILENIRQRVESADTVEAVLAAATSGPTHVEDVLDIPLEFVDWRPLLSGEQYREADGENVYLVMAVINLLTGEELIVQGGGKSIIMIMERVSRLENGFPFRGAFSTKVTNSGYTIHLIRSLTEVERAAVSGK